MKEVLTREECHICCGSGMLCCKCDGKGFVERWLPISSLIEIRDVK